MVQRRVVAAAVVAAAVLIHVVSAQECETGVDTPNVRILNYNAYLFPFASKHRSQRASVFYQDICNADNPPFDILALQEIAELPGFLRSCHDAYPYYALGPDDQGLRAIVGSGLVVLSRYPIRRVRTMIFSDFTGPETLANKGVLFADVDVPVNATLPEAATQFTPVNVFVSHMQSGVDVDDEEKLKSVRVGQTKQFVDFIDEVKTRGAPVVIVGDLHTEPEKDETIALSANDVWPVLGSGAGHTFPADDPMSRPDFILMQQFPTQVNQTGPTTITPLYKLDNDSVALVESFRNGGRLVPPLKQDQEISDHLGVSVTLKFRSVCDFTRPAYPWYQQLIDFIIANSVVLALTVLWLGIISGMTCCMKTRQQSMADFS